MMVLVISVMDLVVISGQGCAVCRDVELLWETTTKSFMLWFDGKT